MSAKKRHAKGRNPFIARVPIPVRGGLHAQVTRTQKSRKWWAAAWLAFMESLRMGARLGRGRAYALSGQVMELSVTAGRCEAVVQGASRDPYSCVISFDVPDDETRETIISRLRARPLTLAQLLVRNLPRSIDRIFRAAGFPLIPTADNSFEVSCSCPDPTPMCKHIAATLFLLTEAFEQDPLLLLSLRGISRDDLLDYRGADGAANLKSQISDFIKFEKPAVGAECEAEMFWGRGQEALDDYGSVAATGGRAALARRLGSIPFWRGEERFLEAMDLCAERSAPAGLRVWAGERPVRQTIVAGSSAEPLRSARPRAVSLDEM